MTIVNRGLCAALALGLAQSTLAQAGHAGHAVSDMQGGSPPADARSPHAYAAPGITLDSGPYIPAGVQRLHLMDEHPLWAVAVDRLEVAHSDDEEYGAFESQAWFGTTYRRLVISTEGEVESGRLEEAETALLYSQALDGYWNWRAGVRHDRSEGPDRRWLAIGLAGMAPYWLEIDAALYLGEGGRSLLEAEVEYELLLTQRLVLQPRVEVAAYGRTDEDNGVGSGLASVTAGLRLRYELSRQFAPYVGVEWQGRFGQTADLVAAEGGDTRTTALVAGVRFWF